MNLYKKQNLGVFIIMNKIKDFIYAHPEVPIIVAIIGVVIFGTVSVIDSRMNRESSYELSDDKTDVEVKILQTKLFLNHSFELPERINKKMRCLYVALMSRYEKKYGEAFELVKGYCSDSELRYNISIRGGDANILNK